jgi:hypothetical protein
MKVTVTTMANTAKELFEELLSSLPDSATKRRVEEELEWRLAYI